MWASHRLINLAKPCDEPTTDGVNSLSALRSGAMPPGLKSWPSSPADQLGLLDTEFSIFQQCAESVATCRDEINEAMIADAGDKDIQIQVLKDENAKLKAKATASFTSKQTNMDNANAVTDPFTNKILLINGSSFSRSR